MAIPEELVSTAIDKLISLVKERDRIEINLAARILSLPVKSLEEWAGILEQEGIITLEYKLAELYLVWKPATKEEIEKRETRIAEKKQSVEVDYSKMSTGILKEKKELDEIKFGLSGFYQAYGKKLDELSAIEEKFQDRQRKVEKDYLNIFDKIDSTLSKLEEINDAIKVMSMNLATLEEESKINKIIEKLQGIKGLKTEVENANKMLSEYAGKIESARGELLQISSKKDAKALLENLSKIYAEIDETRRSVNIVKEKLGSNKNIAEIIENSEKEMKIIEEKINSLSPLFDSKNMGLAELEEKLARAKNDINEIEQRKQNIVSTLGSFKEILVHLKSESRQFNSLNDISKRLDSIEAQLKEVSASKELLEKINEIDKMISDLGKMKIRVEEINNALASEAGDIFTSIDEEMENYKTFEKVRERVVASIKGYLSQLDEIKKENEAMASETLSMKEELSKIVNEAKGMSSKDADSVLQKAKEALEIKDKLKESEKGVADLYSSIERISKGLMVLDKEISLLGMRSKEKEKKEEEKELAEYQEKRKDVSKLVKGLWEESGEKEKEKKRQ